MLEARIIKDSLHDRWWKDWWDRDYSWDGLNRKYWAGWGVNDDGQPERRPVGSKRLRRATLQDFWRAEEQDLVLAPDGRRWTRAHVPARWADGTFAKLGWTEEDHARALTSVNRAVDRLPQGAFIPPPPPPGRKLSPTTVGRWSSWPMPLNGVVLSKAPQPFEELNNVIVRQACFLGPLDIPPNLSVGLELQGCLVVGAFEISDDVQSVRLGRTTFEGPAAFTGTFSFLNAASAIFIGDADFSDCNIDNARFKRAVFYGDATFDSAKIGTGAFEEAVFKSDCDLETATIKKSSWCKAEINRARFSNSILGSANFSEATFTGEADFSSSSLYDQCTFVSARWEEAADFSSATLNRADFRRARFEGDLDLQSATFLGPVHFERAHFQSFVALDKVVWSDDPADFAAAFRGTRFGAFVSLGDAAFHAFAAFDGADFKGEARITGDRFTYKATFKDALARCGTPELKTHIEYGVRALRQAAEGSRDRLLEQTLYRSELLARRTRLPRLRSEHIFSSVYEWVSDYGLSIKRPLGALAGLWLVGAAVYYLIGLTAHLPLQGNWTLYGGGLHPDLAAVGRLSARSILSLFGVWSLRASAEDTSLESALLWDDPGIGLLVRILSSAQSIAAASLLFLTALSLRRRFQIS